MPKRIPHTDKQVITGSKKTQDYLAMQKKFGRFYFKKFFSKFDQSYQPGRFLEVGPGPGYQTVLVAEKYDPEQIIGLEYSSDMIRVGEKYLRQKGMNHKISFIHGAVENTKLIQGLGKFDLIYSTFSLHHWNDPALGIQNLYNSLNEKGTLFVYDFHRGGLLYYIKIERGVWESIRASYTPEEILTLLEKSDIRNFQLEKKGLYMNFMVKKNNIH